MNALQEPPGFGSAVFNFTTMSKSVINIMRMQSSSGARENFIEDKNLYF